MKLTGNRFWIYEAVVIICTVISIVLLWINHLLFHSLFGLTFCLIYIVGSVMAWKLYKGNQWWKLAGYILLVTTSILLIVLLGFVWNWHDTGGRPANLPPDVGTYITNNELVGILMLQWAIVVPILSCVISYITKLIIKYHIGEKTRH
jgi:hypothetical protein